MESSSYPPLKQNLTFYIPNQGSMNITFNDIDQFVQYGIRISINYASQIGASFAVLVVLLLTAPKEKRTTSIFILNTLGLLLNGIRAVMNCCYYAGPFWETYAYFSLDYSQIPKSAFSNSVGTLAFDFLVLICVEFSLFVQVKAVCVTMRSLYRKLVLGVSVTVGLVALGFRLGLTIEDSHAIWTLNNFVSYTWLSASNIYLTTASICVFSFIFVVKLGFTIAQRRKMGLRQFGPMQIIFIMGCQTLIIPAVFSVLQNFTSVPELGAQVITVTVLFLPLSSLWATAAVRNPSSASASLPKCPSGNVGVLKSYRSFSSSGQTRVKHGSEAGFKEASFGALDSLDEIFDSPQGRAHFDIV